MKEEVKQTTPRNIILCGDVIEKLKELPDKSVQCVITSPPYYALRWYVDDDRQIGQEETPDIYVQKMVEVFREVRRVLRDDGTVWLNLGDSFAGSWGRSTSENGLQQVDDGRQGDIGRAGNWQKSARAKEFGLKPKDMIGIPWRVAFALQKDGWWLRRDIIWAKSISFCPTYSGGCMPEPVTDRPTSSHEYVFLLTKSAKYFYDQDAVKEQHVSYGDYERRTNKLKLGDTKHPRSDLCCGDDGFRDREEYYSPSGRNLRSVWTINPHPYPEAHFATFPKSLVEPMIKLGTSEYGSCPKCGAPWVRQVEKGEADEEWKKKSGADSKGEYSGISKKWLKQDALGKQTYTGFNKRWKEKQQNASDVKRNVLNGMREVTYTWNPSCDCGCEERVPCIVLDIFGGSGTIGEAARELGRDWILIELNPEYVKLAEKRLRLNESLDRFY